MRTLHVAHADLAFTPRTRLPLWAPLILAAFQLAFWSLFALVFYLTVRPYHFFPDILLGQAAATAALGLAASAALERLHALLYRRRASAMTLAAGVLVGGVLLGLGWYALAAWAGDAIDPFEYLTMPVPGGALFAPAQMPLYPAALLVWTVLFLAAVQWKAQRANEERTLRSEALAHEARLRMLRYQLNPHFLFNALNSIGALAGEAPERVQRMVGELSGFLRYSLLDAERLEVLLRDELRAVAHYLEVEKVRFEDDLDVRIDLEPEAARRPLPAFLVLPLVENAIKHGRSTSAMPLRIEVAARIERGSSLCIEVKNTGAWRAASQPASAVGTRTGLHNVRERLRARYAGRHALEVYEDDGWVHARIRIDDDR